MNGDGGGNEENGERVVDGGTVTTMDEGVLYTVVRKAVEDAILGVIGISASDQFSPVVFDIEDYSFRGLSPLVAEPATAVGVPRRSRI